MGTPRAGSRDRQPRRSLRLVTTVVLVVAAYYLVPVFEPAGEARTVLRAGATAGPWVSRHGSSPARWHAGRARHGGRPSGWTGSSSRW